MARGSRSGGGWGRGRGRVSADDVQRIATAISDAASRLGLECTVSTGAPLPPQVKFLTACSDGDVDRLKALVDSMDEDDRESLASVRMEGCGPLHGAASTGNMGICKYLVEQLGFDVDADASNHDSGVTPLSCAVCHGKAIAVRYFLDKGADPNKKDSAGFAPLYDAAKEGYDGIARLLLSKGASVDVSSSEGTPLHVAASNGKSGVVKILLEHHANPNKVSADLGTPLAATLCATPERLDESACLKCMKLLVKAGADLNCTIPDTPLVIATSKGLTFSVRYLLEVGANANIPSNHGGSTPIEIAASSGRRKLVESLFPFTSPIQAVSNWSVEGIIAHVKSIHLKDKGKQSDEDRKAQLKAHARKAVKEEYASASKPCTEDKASDKDRKAQLKLCGAKAVEGKNYAGALKFYTEAIKLDPADATLFSNRSLCHLKLFEAQDALLDANACIRLRPEWQKGYYRKGAALMSLKEYKEACDAFMAGLKLDPANEEMQEAFWEAAEAMRKEHLAKQSVSSFD